MLSMNPLKEFFDRLASEILKGVSILLKMIVHDLMVLFAFIVLMTVVCFLITEIFREIFRYCLGPKSHSTGPQPSTRDRTRFFESR